MNIKEELQYLSNEYESGEYVDISAFNYFQEALDKIEWLEVQIGYIKEAAGCLPYDCESLINIIKSHRAISDAITRGGVEDG